MKKTFKFFAAALAIVAAASCAKEIANDNTIQTPETDQELVHKVFTASLNVDPETKTTLHTDGVTVHWTEGDKIALIPVGKTNASHFSINPESIDGTFADFEGQTVVATDYVGVYPSGLYHYSESSWDGSMIHYFKGNTLAIQYAHVGDFPTTSNGNANVAISTTAKDGHLYFQNVNAYFKFQLAFDNATEIVISADAISNDNPITQSVSTILNLGAQLRYKDGYMYGSSGDSPITFKVDNNKTAFTKNATYYVAIPAVYVKGLKFVVKDANGNELVSFSKSEMTFAQNNIYNLGTLEAKPKIGDYYYADGSFGPQYKSNAVGVIFYVGDPHAVDSNIPAEYKNGLVVGLEEISNVAFDSGPSLKGTSIFQPDYYYSSINTSITSNYGYTSTAAALIAKSDAYKMTELHKSKNTSLYQSYNLSSRTKYASNWYVPSCKEYSLMYKSMSVLNAKDNFTDLRSWGASDKSTVFSKLDESPCFGYHTVWQANLDNGWRCINYYYLSDSNEEGIYPTVVRQPNSNHGYPHIGRIIFAF